MTVSTCCVNGRSWRAATASVLRKNGAAPERRAERPRLRVRSVSAGAELARSVAPALRAPRVACRAPGSSRRVSRSFASDSANAPKTWFCESTNPVRSVSDFASSSAISLKLVTTWRGSRDAWRSLR